MNEQKVNTTVQSGAPVHIKCTDASWFSNVYLLRNVKHTALRLPATSHRGMFCAWRTYAHTHKRKLCRAWDNIPKQISDKFFFSSVLHSWMAQPNNYAGKIRLQQISLIYAFLLARSTSLIQSLGSQQASLTEPDQQEVYSHKQKFRNRRM